MPNYIKSKIININNTFNDNQDSGSYSYLFFH